MKNNQDGYCVVVVLVLLVCIAFAYSCVQKEHKAEQARVAKAEMEEQERLRRKAIEEQERKRVAVLGELDAKEAQSKSTAVETRQSALREFAVEHAPELWSTVRDIRALMEDSSARMTVLKKTMETMGKKAEDDEDYQKMGQKRNELAMVLAKLDEDLEAAYIQFAKFQAVQDTKAVSNSVAKALTDGRNSALEARARYELLKKELMP
ncbi:MAG: hypothetical protein PHU80_12000 [Kiritimatiellae bacterium]|nr:hypothetical protein [Kiritimatiellia bacterium]